VGDDKLTPVTDQDLGINSGAKRAEL